MSRCGCTALGCTCRVDDLDTDCIVTHVTGSGSSDDPYLISAEPDLDPSAGNLLTCDGAGLRADLSTQDSATVSFTGDGTPVSPLTATAAATGHTHDGGGLDAVVVSGDTQGIPPTADGGWAMALGDDAHADGGWAIAIGAGPSASGQQSIAIGDYVVASDQGAVALGSGSSASAGNATALGDNASAGGNEATAVGYNALASGVSSVAIGNAGATADGSVAMGASASANHANAVALGDASTTAADQVNIGTKRLFMGAPDSAPADVDLIDGQASLWDDSGTLTLKLKNGVGVVTSHPITTSSMFSYPGALASGTTSPPVRLQSSQTLTLLAVTLGTAGSTNTVLDLLKNGVSVATITVVAADTEHDEVLSIAYAADTDKLALTVTTAGTGAANMTADARFT